MKLPLQELLKSLIATQSFSKEEDQTADLISEFLSEQDIKWQRHLNNVWSKNRYFDDAKPTLLLNSHHDTVRPNPNYTLDPLDPVEKEGKIYGLGSNDAGASLVSLIGAFIHYYHQKDLPCNIILAATAEEEISGKNGIEALLPYIGHINYAIVGEPTTMRMAIAEKGLLVIDAEVTGQSGHAAREAGINAIYLAIQDIQFIQGYKFENNSHWLGPVKMTVTLINAGSQHNVIPGKCSYVIDVRTTDAYDNETVFNRLQEHLKAHLKARSFRLKPSHISENHPLVQAGLKLGTELFGSPTLSDQALLDIPSVKIGPGKSERSHSPDEFIYLTELQEGFDQYIQLIAAFGQVLNSKFNCKKGISS